MEVKKKSESNLTGDRFFDSAASKIMHNNPSFSRNKANCVVSNMVKDGRFGLGEINQMDFSSSNLENNTNMLMKSYQLAKTDCN